MTSTINNQPLTIQISTDTITVSGTSLFADVNTGAEEIQGEQDRAAEVAASEPRVDVTNSAMALRWLQGALGQGRLAGMFERHGAVVFTPREGENGYIKLIKDKPGKRPNSDGPAQIQPITKTGLAAQIDLTHYVFKTNDQGHPIRRLFPETVASRAVSVPHLMPHLRPLAGVIHTPVVRSDGTILNTPGYDEDSGLLFLPDQDLNVPDVPNEPSAGDLERAKKILNELVCDFDFVSAHDEANYYGMLITPMLRLMVPPPYKMGVINAHQPGSGKTLLADCVRIIHSGIFRAEMPEDAAELRKQITSILGCTTGAVVHLDNITGTMRSSVLAGLLSNIQWDDRPLGFTKMEFCVNDRLWVATGNNVSLGGDLPRRSFWCTIDPQVPNPHLRTGFKDLKKWARENRADLLWAILILIRSWHASGAVCEEPTSDSYGEWISVINGILRHAGIPGVFDHTETDQTDGTGTDDEEWRDFLSAAYEVFQGDEWTVTEMLACVERTSLGVFTPPGGDVRGRIPLDSIPAPIAKEIIKAHGETAGVRRTFGQWLRNRKNRWAGDYSAHKSGTRKKEAVWSIKISDRNRTNQGVLVEV